jgi:hypothetical protein
MEDFQRSVVDKLDQKIQMDVLLRWWALPLLQYILCGQSVLDDNFLCAHTFCNLRIQTFVTVHSW